MILRRFVSTNGLVVPIKVTDCLVRRNGKKKTTIIIQSQAASNEFYVQMMDKIEENQKSAEKSFEKKVVTVISLSRV